MKTTEIKQNLDDAVPSEKLMQTALRIGFSEQELHELRSVYCFAMDCSGELRASKGQQKIAGKVTA